MVITLPLIMVLAMIVMRVSMAATITTMTMSMAHISKEKHAKNIDSQSYSSNQKNQLRVLNCLKHKKPLESLHRYRKAESKQEDSIHQSTHHLRPGPAVRVLAPLLGAHPAHGEGLE